MVRKHVLFKLLCCKSFIFSDVCNSIPTEEHVCPETEVKGTKAAKFCKKLVSDPRFAPCHGVMDVTILEDACRWDFCSCRKEDPAECACETLNVYVRECLHKGVRSLTNWRDENTCRMYHYFLQQ